MAAGKNETIYLRGPVMFPWVHKPNTPEWYEDPAGFYSVDIGVDREGEDLVRSWSHMYKAKNYKEPYNEDADPSLKYFQFKRPVNGKVAAVSGAPKVVDSEGNDWTDEMGIIGNGSVCTVKLSVYTGKTKKGSEYKKVTLAGIRVDELREYKRDEDSVIYDEPIAAAVGVSDADDGIPF